MDKGNASYWEMRNAMFVVSCHGDGAGAYLVHGWTAMCNAVVAEQFDDPDDQQRAEVIKLLNDEDFWSAGFDGQPYHWSVRFEDGGIGVLRITHNMPKAAR